MSITICIIAWLGLKIDRLIFPRVSCREIRVIHFTAHNRAVASPYLSFHHFSLFLFLASWAESAKSWQVDTWVSFLKLFFFGNRIHFFNSRKIRKCFASQACDLKDIYWCFFHHWPALLSQRSQYLLFIILSVKYFKYRYLNNLIN